MAIWSWWPAPNKPGQPAKDAQGDRLNQELDADVIGLGTDGDRQSKFGCVPLRWGATNQLPRSTKSTVYFRLDEA